VTILDAPLVVMDGGRIVAVQGGGLPPQDVEVVDFPGATLMPGLVDAHVHLAFDAGVDPVAALVARDAPAALAAMRAAAATALAGGVTTVRDLGDRDYLALELREATSSSARLPGIVAALLSLYRAGARFIAASDAGIHADKPHDVARHIPATLAAIGLPLPEGLRLVTSAAADACGLTGRKGRLAAGHDGDLLVIDGDPTADPTALHRILAVHARGRRVR